MKKYILVSAVTAVIVSTLIWLAVQHFGLTGSSVLRVEHVSQTPVRGAMFTVNAEGDLVPLDFTRTAERVIDAVVHIKASQTVAANSRSRGRNPMDDFFGDDLFERFFGPQFRFESPGPREPQVRMGTGSGVIISVDGYIITNNHVIADADDIEVTLNDNRNFKARLVGVDPTTDLALLQIEADGLPTLTFMNSDEVKIGEWVMAVGNPFNLNSTVTAGIVSAKARNINILRDQFAVESFIQTDAAINPGNSGGALVDLEGRLIGINTAIASPTGSYSGYGFAIPSNIVRKVVEDLAEFGTVQRGFIGAVIRSVDNDLAREKKLDVVRGVYVDSLVAGGAAEAAGIKAGDVIVAVNQADVNTNSELLEMIARHRPGDKLSIRVNRGGSLKTFTVVLNNRDGNTARIKEESSSLKEKLGAELATLPKERAKKLEIPGGVEVKKLGPGKLRKETGMKEGYIITRVNGKEVTQVQDVERILEGHQGGVFLEGRYADVPGVVYYAFGL